MPSIAEATLSPPSRMKRRRGDTSFYLEGPTKLSRQAGMFCSSEDPALMSQSSSPSQLRHMPTPDSAPIFSSELMEQYQPLERRLIHAKPRRLHESKRQRVSIDPSLSSEYNPLFTREPLGHNFGNTLERHPHDSTSRVEATREARPKIDLNPCHICHRKPTVKTELDQYDDCEGCGRRTCYICMRKCAGWAGFGMMLGGGRYDVEGDYDVLGFSLRGEENGYDGRTRNGRGRMDSGYEGEDGLNKVGVWEKGRMNEHRSKICSGCCVERGLEGETSCLGCLRVEECI